MGGAAPPALPSPLLSAGGVGAAGGGKLGREVSGGTEGARRSPLPLGRGAALWAGAEGKREGWLRGGGWPRGRAFQRHTKGSGQGRSRRSPWGFEGRWGAGPGPGEVAAGPERAISPPERALSPRVLCDGGVWVRFVCFCQM